MSRNPIPDEHVPYQPTLSVLPEPLLVTTRNDDACGPYRAIAVAVGPVMDRDLHYGLYDATALLCVRGDGRLTWLGLRHVAVPATEKGAPRE